MKISRSEISRLWPIVKRRTGAAIVRWVQRLFSGEKMLKDVFKRRSNRRVLLCHLPEAFVSDKQPKYHSNLTECYMAARCFDRLGYSVDCSSRGNEGIDYSPYEIIFGINGNAFLGSFTAQKGDEPMRIFYSVGAQMTYNFKVTAQRNIAFHKRHGLWLLGSNRYIPASGMNYYQAHFADAVICLGDRAILEPFLIDDTRTERYRYLPAFYFKVTEPDKEKDFSKCRKTLLWFGSMGLLHKGLDIAIDFAVAHPDYTLHICGGSSSERDFWRYYQPIVEKADNIHIHGFVDIESPEFVALLDSCGILLNPSISESGAVAVLNVLGNGALMPVYSSGTALELADVGVEVPQVTYEDFEKALLGVEAMSDDEFAGKAWAAHCKVRDGYTLAQYEERLYNHICEIIDKKDKK